MLRCTCSTYMAQITSVKDVQAHLRHTTAKTTLEHYIKIGARERPRCRRIFGSVVEEKAERFRNTRELYVIESNSQARRLLNG
jgi:integrase